MTSLLAIDPGAKGGYAVRIGEITRSGNLPATEGDIIELFRSFAPDECYLEDLVKYTGVNMPSSAMATYASNWGFLKGVLQTLGCRVVLVRPQEWQKSLSLGTSKGISKTIWKNKLKERAQQLFPAEKVTLQNADALLILEYARKVTHASV
jgi:hypothetical protein